MVKIRKIEKYMVGLDESKIFESEEDAEKYIKDVLIKRLYEKIVLQNTEANMLKQIHYREAILLVVEDLLLRKNFYLNWIDVEKIYED